MRYIHGWRELNLPRAFVNDVIDNDEIVASSKEHTQFKTKVQKTIPV